MNRRAVREPARGRTTARETPADSRAAAAAQHLYEAEFALRIARESHVDEWIAAAGDRLHQAVAEHLAAIAEQETPRSGGGDRFDNPALRD